MGSSAPDATRTKGTRIQVDLGDVRLSPEAEARIRGAVTRAVLAELASTDFAASDSVLIRDLRGTILDGWIIDGKYLQKLSQAQVELLGR